MFIISFRLLSIFILAILTPFFIGAQQQGNNWIFGNRAGISFNSGSPVSFGGSAMNAWEGVASISDENGNLLFYTDGITIWDANHNPMPNGNGLNGDPSSSQSGVIVPKPGDPDLFYVLSVPAGGGNLFNNARLYYSLVDMSLNGGLGDVVNSEKNVNLSPNHRIQEKVAAILHCNGEDIWVLAHEYGSNTFLVYLIDDTNPPTLVNEQSIGESWNGSTNSSIGILKASSDGSKIGETSNDNDVAQVLDFDNATGTLSNPVTFDNIGWSYGVEFSPNSNVVYFTSWYHFDPSKILYQYDLTAPDPNSTRVELTTVANLGAMQLGPDGIIYVARNTDDGGGGNNGRQYLGAITNPNNYDGTSAAFGWVEEAVDLGGNEGSPANGRLSRYGLPNFIQSYFQEEADFTYVDTCLFDATTFTPTIPYDYVSVEWIFEGGNTSTDLNPSYTFHSEGTYEVELHIIQNCKTDTVRKTITILPSLIENFTGNQSACSNTTETYSIDPIPGYTINWNVTGGTVTSGDGTNSVNIQWSSTGNHTISISLSPTADCSEGSFSVSVTDCASCTPPTLTVDDISVCGAANVDLTTAVSNEEAQTTTSFYTSQADADNGANAIITVVTQSGTYFVRNERDDDATCYNTYAVNVDITAEEIPTFTQITPICQNDAAPTLPTTSNENITGSWDNVITTDQLGTTTYTFTPDPNECANSTTMDIEVIDCSQCTPPTITVDDISVCGAADVDLTTAVSNEEAQTTTTFYASQADADNGANAINTVVTQSGTYFVRNERDDDATCYNTYAVTVDITAEAPPTFTQITPICQNDAAPTLPTSSNENITGSWDNVITTDQLGTTTYTFTPDPNECATSTTMDIEVIDCSQCTPPTITVDDISVCGIADVNLTTAVSNEEAQTNTTFYASQADADNGANAINSIVTQSGTYYVRNERNDDASCYNTYSVTVDITTEETPTFTQIDPICQNETAPTLPTSSNENITGSWDAAVSTDQLGTTTYTFTPNQGQCASETTMDIEIIDCFECTPPNFSTENISYCEGDLINLMDGVFDNPAGTSVSFHSNQNDALSGTNPINPVQDTSGVFFVRVFYDTDPSCFSFGNLTLTIQEIIKAELTIPDFYCRNNGLDTLLAFPQEGTWSGPGIIDPILGVFDPSIANDTTLIIFTPNGTCVDTTQHEIIVFPNPTAEIYGGEVTVLEGTEVILSTDDHTTYAWSPTDYLSCSDCASPSVIPYETETYLLEVTNEFGCTDTASTTITVIKECHGAFVPENFSPNGDGTNDVLCVFSNCIVTMRFEIFNRWGEKVFISEDMETCWDGTYRGERVNAAVFVYRFEAELSNGETVQQSGNITVYR